MIVLNRYILLGLFVVAGSFALRSLGEARDNHVNFQSVYSYHDNYPVARSHEPQALITSGARANREVILYI